MKLLSRLFILIAVVFLVPGITLKTITAQNSDITFTLINAATNQPVPGYDPIPLYLGGSVPEATLNFRFLPPQLSIRANVPAQYESVRLVLMKEFTTLTNVVENFPPYALAGDNNGNYAPFTFTGIGGDNQNLWAIPYTQNGARGEAGPQAQISLLLVDRPGDFKFTLVNAQTNQDIMEINNGDILFMFDLPSDLNIRADITDGAGMTAESVRFDLSNNDLGPPFVSIENIVPYALFGDNNGNYAAGTFDTYTYTLMATAFTQNGARGQVVASATIEFIATWSMSENNEDIVAYNYPNPFVDVTNLAFQLPEAGEVQLMVYDLLGQHVTTLTDGWREAGPQLITFDAGNAPEGLYFYKLRVSEVTLSGRMLLKK